MTIIIPVTKKREKIKFDFVKAHQCWCHLWLTMRKLLRYWLWFLLDDSILLVFHVFCGFLCGIVRNVIMVITIAANFNLVTVMTLSHGFSLNMWPGLLLHVSCWQLQHYCHCYRWENLCQIFCLYLVLLIFILTSAHPLADNNCLAFSFHNWMISPMQASLLVLTLQKTLFYCDLISQWKDDQIFKGHGCTLSDCHTKDKNQIFKILPQFTLCCCWNYFCSCC